jgi:hypothetical protein
MTSETRMKKHDTFSLCLDCSDTGFIKPFGFFVDSPFDPQFSMPKDIVGVSRSVPAKTIVYCYGNFIGSV